MRIYLASRYSRRAEMLEYAAWLTEQGDEVVSRWITGMHEIPGKREDGYSVEEQRHFADEDLKDIDLADVLIAFTEERGSPFTRGGRHVELGYALAAGKEIAIVGPRENCFCCLPGIRWFSTWEEMTQGFRIIRQDHESGNAIPATGMSEAGREYGRFQREVGEWAERTFTQATDRAILAHLRREIDELGAELPGDNDGKIDHEFGDCVLLLMHLGHRRGVNLLAAAFEKHVINTLREWGEPDADGVVEHVRETVTT